MATPAELSGTLFFGDNLDVLRDNFGDESVDLIYLDPPFNSNADYNVLFADESGAAPPSQVWAYGDQSRARSVWTDVPEVRQNWRYRERE